MKYLLPIIALLLALIIFSLPSNAQKKKDEMVLTVDYVLKNEDGTGEVWAKYHSRYNNTARIYYVGIFSKPIPDTLIPGKKIILSPKPKDYTDTCQCR